MSTPTGEPDESLSGLDTASPAEASSTETSPAGEASRDLNISRRELRYLAEHLRRSRKHLDAHYDQLAWLNARQTERQAQLRQEEERLASVRQDVEGRRQEIDEQGHALDERQREQKEQSQAEQARLEQLRHESEEREHQAQEQRTAAQAELDRRRQQFEEQQRADRERWTAEQSDMEKSLAAEGEQIARQRQDIVEAEAALRLQRDDLLAQKAEHQERDNQELADLRREVEALKAQLADAEKEAAQAAEYRQRETELRGEVSALRGRLDGQGAAVENEPADESEPAEPVPAISLETGVDEVTAFCQQLEADHRAVEGDLRQLQARHGRRDGGAMASAPEHASLRQGRAQLNHLREEIRQEMERLQRAADARGRVGGKPTAQGTQRRPTGDGESAPTKARGTFHGLRRWLGGKG